MDKEAAYTIALGELDRGVWHSIRACSRAYKLEHSQLIRRRKGQTTCTRGHEDQQLLSNVQEDMLVRWLLEAETAGHAFNHQQLREMASIISKASGGDGVIGKHWMVRFLQRHPELQSSRASRAYL